MLAAGGWTAAVRPEVGGALSGLWLDGRPVLRPAADGVTEPLEMASFPLLPYANRIAHGRFRFGGRDVQLPLNFGDHPHSLHGIGWQRPWQVVHADRQMVELAHAHDGQSGWPWPYDAMQRIRLGADGMEAVLRMRNVGSEPMPAGLGHHPYFPAGPGTKLRAQTRSVWLSDATMLPEREVAADHFADWAQGADVARPVLVDHAHDGWDGLAIIHQPWGDVRMKATGAGVLHIYSAPGRDFVCAEPVSHLPDALNHPEFLKESRMAVLEPGEGMEVVMRLTVQPQVPPA